MKKIKVMNFNQIFSGLSDLLGDRFFVANDLDFKKEIVK